MGSLSSIWPLTSVKSFHFFESNKVLGSVSLDALFPPKLLQLYEIHTSAEKEDLIRSAHTAGTEKLA